MNPQLEGMLRRIEVLERHNRRLKQLAASACLALAVAFALAARAQQSKPPKEFDPRSLGAIPVNQPKQAKARPAKKIDTSAGLAPTLDGEVDEAKKKDSVAAYDVALPHDFAKRVARIPTIRGKLDALARGMETLQGGIILTNVRREGYDEFESKLSVDEMNQNTDEMVKIFTRLGQDEQQLNELTALAADDDTKIHGILAGTLPFQSGDLKQELEDFKAAACPVLRRANAGPNTRLKLDSACGLDY